MTGGRQRRNEGNFRNEEDTLQDGSKEKIKRSKDINIKKPPKFNRVKSSWRKKTASFWIIAKGYSTKAVRFIIVITSSFQVKAQVIIN